MNRIISDLFKYFTFGGRITKVYESEAYDYPSAIQESLAELSTSLGHNITSFAAANLKGTKLPAPAAPAPVHKTLPHALGRAATSAAAVLQMAAPTPQADGLGNALSLYAQGMDKVAAARLEQVMFVCISFPQLPEAGDRARTNLCRPG
jgi:hypothetical protein